MLKFKLPKYKSIAISGSRYKKKHLNTLLRHSVKALNLITYDNTCNKIDKSMTVSVSRVMNMTSNYISINTKRLEVPTLLRLVVASKCVKGIHIADSSRKILKKYLKNHNQVNHLIAYS